ncbi:MAG: restriction endonuclease subunit S [Aquamicrobium sp.]|uniref:restriction endonuclease subunit S n=1 Tax=Mesorhizobium sp. Pch-S TaxID=2082387 RepID=UPI0013EC2CE6|nr:restriction endonuclease subunit S [Mesorhizobium sp. Pch-S]MBR2686642.1 restriction endonuclease subunit S [Aquamicrobium sp.]
MKGLEVTVLPFSELENLLTIGAEYYGRAYVSDQLRLQSGPLPLATLGELCTLITDGDHGVADYQDHGVPFILSENVKEGWIDIGSVRHISEAHHQSLARSKIRSGDVLVTKTGLYFGKSAVVDEQLGEANTIAHVGILRIAAGHDPYVLSTFLNCRYGQTQLRRRGIKATRPEIKLVEFQNIQAPLVSPQFAQSLRATIQKSKAIRREVENAVLTASNTLLAALDLAGWTPPDPLTYTATLSNYATEGRLDAQFHRPKFVELFRLHAARFELFRLGGVVLKGRTVPYVDDGEVPIIRSGDLSDIDDDERFLRAASTEPIFYLHKGDILISSIGFGSIGKVQVFDKAGKFGTVSEVTVVRQSTLNPYYLATYLRSAFGQMQIDRYITGATGQLHLNPKDVEKFFIPVIPTADQLAFEHLSQEIVQTKARASALLAAARHAVEIAIEDNEAAAIAYLIQAEEAT